MNNKETLKKLNESFGSYRAEWLKGKIFNLFAEPSYFTALQDNRPCVLQGGRGTGKTTVLRGLSYQGQFALHNSDINKFNESSFIGIYHRVNTNHVRAFIGGELTEDNWMKVFAHYFNLIIVRDILVFLKWHKNLQNEDEELPKHVCNLIAKSVHVKPTCDTLDELLTNLELEMYEFQAKVNNIQNDNMPSLSMAGDPIKIVTEHSLGLSQFANQNKIFFILLDEYENYEDYQQQILNTLIKHNTEHYSFKVGVRELGWRVKHTLNPSELLHDPADYVLIDIERKLTNESHFSDFAKNVCQQRIQQLINDDASSSIYNIENSFGFLSMEEEAELLDVKSTNYVKAYENLSEEYKGKVKDLPLLYKFFIAYWAFWHSTKLEDAIDDYLKTTIAWDTRYENYKYDMLFKIRKGRGKRGIQKYYSGWITYTKLANGNIRYLMELVYRAYEKHLNNENDLRKNISAKDQTAAAQEVGLKNLMELEGLWKNGAQLTKLLLGFGRVFQILACSEGNSAPEKNQFSIENSESLSLECQELLTAAIMNLAIVRSPGNKLSETAHTKDYEYAIHPIYSAFFVFSHRKKRKIIIKQEDVLGIIKTPKVVIKAILEKSQLQTDFDDSLPNQMKLFEGFYND